MCCAPLSKSMGSSLIKKKIKEIVKTNLWTRSQMGQAQPVPSSMRKKKPTVLIYVLVVQTPLLSLESILLYGTPSLSYVNLFNYMRCNLQYMRCILHYMRCILHYMWCLSYYMHCFSNYMRCFCQYMRYFCNDMQCFRRYMRCFRHYTRYFCNHMQCFRLYLRCFRRCMWWFCHYMK